MRIRKPKPDFSFKLFLPGIILAGCLACVKDKPEPDKDDTGKQVTEHRVFIANEGSLGSGNASLSVYDKETGEIRNEVFYKKNGSYLGDVFQSLIALDDQLFLAINNSDKIIVIRKDNYQLIDEISVRKPRYILPLTAEKMYVSSLFYPEINILNPKTREAIGKIPVDYPNTEGMLALGNKVYACNWDTACTYLYEIDPANDVITHRIPLGGAAPNQVLADKNGQLWVLSGNVEKGKQAALTQVDPVSRSIIQSFTFPATSEILKPVFNPGKDTLYFLGVNYTGDNDYNGVFRMAITEHQLPQQPFIPAQPLQYFWGLGLDLEENEIYVGDPKGFIQRGSVSIYNTSGTVLHTFSTELGPGFFYFE